MRAGIGSGKTLGQVACLPWIGRRGRGLATISRPVMGTMLAGIGLALVEVKALPARQQDC